MAVSGLVLFIRIDDRKRHGGGIDQQLARMLEIYRHTLSHHGLDLTQAPVGLCRVTDENTGCQEIGHRQGFQEGEAALS